MNTREIDFWIGAEDPRIKPEHFNQIVATAADIAIVINLDGVIETVVINPLNRSVGKLDHWINRDLRDFLALDSATRVEALLAEYRAGKTDTTTEVEVNHFDNANWDFPIRYSFHTTGHENSLLMLGRDLRPIAELQQRLVKAQLALEKDYESRRDFETRYRVLMESSRDALALIDAASGRLTDLNEAAAHLLGADADTLVGNLFFSEFDVKKRSDALDQLIDSAAANGETSVKFTASRSTRPVAIFPKLFRAGGDRSLLCRLEGETRSEGVAAELADNLTGLFKSGIDAVIFTDDKGRIRSANESFLNLTDTAALSNLKNRNLSDFLVRENVDLKVLLDNAARSGRMRMYSTRLIGQHGSEVPVEISATHLTDSANSRFAFVIRDASRREVLRDASDVQDDEKMRNVLELVGSSPLKDIVSATTDVIEKICIQTAVELTGNNRVAAAEMLGLSRQSLYVKLRKYGLLDKNASD